MSDDTNSKIKGKALRDFNDAGTSASFVKDQSYNFEPGAFANYKAAGLVEPDEAPAQDAPRKAGSKPA